MINIILTILLCLIPLSVQAQTVLEQSTASYFETIKNQPSLLKSFLTAMPKGGDLHNHESGASYAENLIQYAKEDNLCIDPQTFKAYSDDFCLPQYRLNNAVSDPVMYDNILDAWSMHHFIGQGKQGHDHFFSTFGKFSAISSKHGGEMLAEIMDRAAKENESYLELMVTADKNDSGALGKKMGWDPDFKSMREKLLASDFSTIIQSMTASLDKDEKKMRTILDCEAQPLSSSCQMTVRYLYQVLREQPPEMVFAQLLAGFEGALHDKRIVGINMVQPEDGLISMRDYELQMRMIAYLRGQYPDVPVTLHAGELTSELVPAEGVTFHISEAVNIAHANRIGHGVDINHENNASAIMQKMAADKTLVEINLSSNAAILDVEGQNHPITTYLRYGVPVTLSTDDEGVSRSNLTSEYLRAVTTYQFTYDTIKQFARNSLMYAFADGKPLWLDDHYQVFNAACQSDAADHSTLSSSCQQFLKANEKARLQWDLEKRFLTFEKQFDGAAVL